jgi:hypothetical protein
MARTEQNYHQEQDVRYSPRKLSVCAPTRTFTPDHLDACSTNKMLPPTSLGQHRQTPPCITLSPHLQRPWLTIPCRVRQIGTTRHGGDDEWPSIYREAAPEPVMVAVRRSARSAAAPLQVVRIGCNVFQK